MVSAQTGTLPSEWDAQSSLGFCDTNGSSNLDQMTRPSDSLQKKKKKKKKVNLSNNGLCCFSWQQGKTERKRKGI